jgi:hypothetical protein
MENPAPSLLKPALIAGVSFGIAGAIPIVEWINCACCALIIGCGVLAAFLHSKQMKEAGLGFTAGNGAVAGLAGGIVYGIVAGFLGALIDNLLGLTDVDTIIEQMEQFGTMDPEAMEMASGFLQSTGPATFAVVGVFFSLLLGAIFGSLGGLIGGALFKGVPTPTHPTTNAQWPTDPPAPTSQDPPPPPPVEPGV